MASHAIAHAREDGEDAAAEWQSCVLHRGWEEASHASMNESKSQGGRGSQIRKEARKQTQQWPQHSASSEGTGRDLCTGKQATEWLEDTHRGWLGPWLMPRAHRAESTKSKARPAYQRTAQHWSQREQAWDPRARQNGTSASHPWPTAAWLA